MNLKSILLVSAFGIVGAANAAVVINKVYGAGGNTGATLLYDYVELYNNGTSAFSLNGYSIQYGSATSTTTFSGIGAFDPTASVAAGGYFLIQLASGGANGVAATATPDATFSSINLSATTGKVILYNGTTAATVPTPGSSTAFTDLVGFGTSNLYEGTVATAPSATTFIGRTATGVDTNNNGVDFSATTVAASTFRSASPVPEPSAFAALGLGVVAIMRRRRSVK